jgi:flagellar FliJ protein
MSSTDDRGDISRLRKFTFTLHALLHLKESVEKQERNDLAVATRRFHMLENEREELVQRREGAAATYAAMLTRGMAVSETQRFTDYFRMMKDLLEEQDRKITEVQEEIEACRKKLVEVMREIRMFENLRDRQYSQYLQEVQAEEEKTIGDFVSFQTNLNPQDKYIFKKM